MPSTSQELSHASRRPALVAFLRGIELRAWVFAWNQCGDEAKAEHALASAFHDFLRDAAELPLAAWPIHFWSSLLAQTPLMTPPGAGSPLAELAPGPRAALLLRLVAGLDIAHAAEALGVPEAAYEKALHRALAHPALDAGGLQSLRESLQLQVHDAPAAQRQLLATWRDEAVLAIDDVIAPDVLPRTVGRMRRWMVIAGVLAVSLIGVVTHFALRPAAHPVQVIDQVAPPPSMSDTIAVTHPDYLQVAVQDDAALVRDLAFLSWLAAATLPTPAAIDETPVRAAPAQFGALPAPLQGLLDSARSAWPELDAATRDNLLRQADDWAARQPARRDQLRQRLVAWDALSAPERARQRTPFLAWQRLSETDRRQIRIAADRLAGLPPSEGQALREQFAAAPADTQALWWLGPALGQELAPFSSLFAFMPESDRPALLQVLRELDDDSRANLATLAPRLTEARRQALRRDLLAAPAAGRAQLIRERLLQ